MVSFNLGSHARPISDGAEHLGNAKPLAEFFTVATRFDDMMIRAGGGPALSPQGYLVLNLLIHGPMPVKQAFHSNPLSYRAFYHMLARLKKQSIISIEVDSSDRRMRRLVLGPEFEPIRTYLSLR
jgi:hypothetical protein